MFKKQHLALVIAATLAAGAAQAALETSVTLKNETAYMTSDSIRTGEATSTTDTTGDGKGVYKFENTAKIYLNDEMDNGMSWHGELNIVRDSKAIDGYDGHESYSQQDYLRELYLDTTVGDWDLRIGKQQVVWGTADGIKLLDMVNPTDYREFNQNTMADARIPVWMINAEKYLDNGGNVQVIFSQAESNKVAGMMDPEGTRTAVYNGGLIAAYGGAGTIDNSQLVGVDSGHPFIMKGVDTITGKVNGFMNIAPAMGAVASTFHFLAVAGAGAAGLTAFAGAGATVNEFATDGAPAAGFAGACDGGPGAQGTGSKCLSNIAEATNLNGTNLLDDQTANNVFGTGGASAEWDIGDGANSAFEYVGNANFVTFDSFAGLTTRYDRKSPDFADGNFSTRFKNTTSSGLNYSVNYSYAYDANPSVNLSYEQSNGQAAYAQVDNNNEIRLFDAASGGNQVCSAAAGDNPCTLVFTEEMHRSHNLGASFDTALDIGDSPIVLRGEFLYQKDVYQPVIDRGEMTIGNLTEALKSLPADQFKYVIGADTTVMTDMMLSGQFIQFRNLDYIDETSSRDPNFRRYTGDMATLHLSNGMQAAEENKEFYSIFLSKPFGDSGEGRWNNIFIYEENGGKWNRFDVEYGFDDQLIGTFEVNKYFGDENTMFGQFKNASNVQIGVKYLLQ
jgi:hypothetical protein